MAKTVIFTGGGSGGHVIPALTLIRALKKKSPATEVITMGSYHGIEARLFKEEGLTYKGIFTGKLRRYFSWQNFLDLFRLSLGFFQSYFYLLNFSRRDTVVFGTGGFVIVPVVIAAKLQFKKVVIHEQTSRVGLANKLASIVADQVFLTFESSKKFFPAGKTSVLGYPLREEILNPPSLESFSSFKEIKSSKPILFLTGGGNGSQLLNQTLESCLSTLVKKYLVIHQCGSRFYDSLKDQQNESYFIYPFVKEEMVGLMNEADVVISRAGAGTVVELMSLGKPSILIPLKIAQKNEQYHNAMEAKELLGSIVIEEDQLNIESFLQAVEEISSKNRGDIVKENPTDSIINAALDS